MAIQECLRQNFGRVELVEDVFVLLRDRIEDEYESFGVDGSRR